MTLWAVPPNQLTLNAQEAHLWFVDLSKLHSSLSSLENVLSPEEAARASRFVQEKHRKRFAMSWGVLRIILGHYLDLAPELLSFGRGERGKPHLTNDATLFFNMSHSKEVALYLVARKEVGVDIEWCDSKLEHLELAERFYAPSEYAQLQKMPESKLIEGFYRGWTCKEAYIKALGLGLYYALDSFSVCLDEKSGNRLQSDKENPEYLDYWSVFSVDMSEIASGFAAAMTIPKTITNVSYFHFEDMAMV